MKESNQFTALEKLSGDEAVAEPQLVELMKGVQVEQDLGKGIELEVVLPLQPHMVTMSSIEAIIDKARRVSGKGPTSVPTDNG